MITPDRLTRNSAEPPNRGNYYQHNYIKLVGNVNRNRKFSQKTSLAPLDFPWVAGGGMFGRDREMMLSYSFFIQVVDKEMLFE